MLIPSTHISLTSETSIKTICQPLFSNTEINFFIYVRFYRNGTTIALPSNAAWHYHFHKMEYIKTSSLRLKPGFHLWSTHNAFSQAVYDARNNFDIDNKFEIVEKGLDYYDVFGFGSKPGKTEVVDFYLNNINALKNFTLYFKEKASDLIEQCKLEPKNRLKIRDMSDKDYASNFGSEQATHAKKIIISDDLNQYNLNLPGIGEINLTRREMECLAFFFRGKPAIEIAHRIGISPKTVESYISAVKEKFDCRKRSELYDKIFEYNINELIAEYFLAIV